MGVGGFTLVIGECCWVYFGWWWVVVGLFWVELSDGHFILGGAGECWVFFG